MRGKTWIATTIAAEEVKARSDTSANFDFTAEEIQAWKADPVLYLAYRKKLEAELQSGFSITQRGSEAQREARALFTQLMKTRLAKKPEVAEHMLPDFPPLCKRLTPGPGYLESLTQDNVTVIAEGIESVTATGIKSKDGKHREVDAIVCATGFDTSWLNRFPIYGVDSLKLGDKWKERQETYLSLATSHFPNFFMSLGPNSGVGHGNLLMIIERVADYVALCLHKIQTENIRTMQPSARAVTGFTDYADAYFEGTVFSEECSSWYKSEVAPGKKGRVSALWPGSSLHAIKALERPRWEDFEYEYVDGNALGWMGDGWSQLDRLDGADRTWYLDGQRMVHEELEAGVEGEGERNGVEERKREYDGMINGEINGDGMDGKRPKEKVNVMGMW